MIYLILLYWFVGVFVILRDWLKDFDLEASFFVVTIILFWIIWPLIFLKGCDFVIVRKND